MKKTYLLSPLGNLCIEADGEAVTALYICESDLKNEDYSEVLELAKSQLNEYFKGKRQQFEIPLHLKGTEFQMKVWNALLKIPYGKTCSYADIAKKIDNPKACRAVGGAVNKNPVMIIVPCHRVIGRDGSLVGFGAGLDVKTKLLNIEKC